MGFFHIYNLLNVLIHIAKKILWFVLFFVAQLAFKQAKFYFWIQNDRAKVRMRPSWIWRTFQNSYLNLQLLEKYLVLCFLTFRIINNRFEECQIFLQRLNSFFLLRGYFETGSKISPVWMLIAPRRKIQIQISFAMYIRTLSRFKIRKNPTSDFWSFKARKRKALAFYIATSCLSSQRGWLKSTGGGGVGRRKWKPGSSKKNMTHSP